ncbi:hypothetical protein EVAR_37899_1 [Eumeta japonica]|uniref:Uncharacterized protein n=1 Tax=Eumeta variegata TaxID=151549 RepID=A0A4C1Y8Z4_EUMVA|nr:hypothetical protein EVAR_37899_1 [Eumeta japonica]
MVVMAFPASIMKTEIVAGMRLNSSSEHSIVSAIEHSLLDIVIPPTFLQRTVLDDNATNVDSQPLLGRHAT